MLTDVIITKGGIPIFHYEFMSGFTEDQLPLTTGLLTALVDFAQYLETDLNYLPFGNSTLVIKTLEWMKIACRVTSRDDVLIIENVIKSIAEVLSSLIMLYDEIGLDDVTQFTLPEGIIDEINRIIDTQYRSKFFEYTPFNSLIAIDGNNVIPLYSSTNSEIILNSVINEFENHLEQYEAGFSFMQDFGFHFVTEIARLFFITKLSSRSNMDIYAVRMITPNDTINAYFSFYYQRNYAQNLFQSLLDQLFKDDSVDPEDNKTISQVDIYWEYDRPTNKSESGNVLQYHLEYLMNTFNSDLPRFLSSMSQLEPIFIIGPQLYLDILNKVLNELFPELSIGHVTTIETVNHNINLVNLDVYYGNSEFIDELISSDCSCFNLINPDSNINKNDVLTTYFDKILTNDKLSTSVFVLKEQLKWYTLKMFAYISDVNSIRKHRQELNKLQNPFEEYAYIYAKRMSFIQYSIKEEMIHEY